ncbi:sigma-54 factor activator interacting domain protein [Megasphaera vaginalis (ex Srinivasan et al. 2021)]|uniref:Sigma-54 factor activator interacting domain protein n=1 Tax=Megasphaera vaginalis (ex Srinivasan et al. 2021) TaxID=1111454 RepID=U7UJR6_9FIRM|nr:sigma-54 factor activator interacting domain protein [Megasphaera vaginalis (ex Srinivasan et al. 2021)]ERT59647.1 sigma-54 factor activator interacting domain protein [Megasphaera vaginalis (ex Srinivasan et al. 2021)]
MTTKTALSQAQQQEQQLRVYQLQSLHLLSLSNEELQDFLQQAYRENPLMDYRAPVKNHDNTADIWDFLAAPEEKKIKNYILEQLNPQLYSSQQWTLLSYLAELVDEDGFLVLEKKAFLARCPLPEGLFDSCLAILQSLNPPGICTASVTECLLEQLRRKKN